MKTKIILAIMALSLSIFGLMSCTEENGNTLSPEMSNTKLSNTSNTVLVNPYENYGIEHNQLLSYLMDNDLQKIPTFTDLGNDEQKYFNSVASIFTQAYVNTGIDPNMNDKECLILVEQESSKLRFLYNSIFSQYGNNLDLGEAILNYIDNFIIEQIPATEHNEANKLRALYENYYNSNFNATSYSNIFPLYTTQTFIENLDILELEFLNSNNVAKDSPLLKAIAYGRYSAELWDNYINRMKSLLTKETGNTVKKAYETREELKMLIHQAASFQVAIAADMGGPLASLTAYQGQWWLYEHPESWAGMAYHWWLDNLTDSMWNR